ncbi:hypothetical protein [Aeromicrobium sp. 179-A 4D2 NHS]|uniref:hypothetical protein n=1 Tax=Aeromicrobium sp. 179-A 4D2 NHS TaxID=3142375 RepID=UPI0039A32D3B
MTEPSWSRAEIYVRPVDGDVAAGLTAVRQALAEYRVAAGTVLGEREGAPDTVVVRVALDDQLRLAAWEDGGLVPGPQWSQLGQHLARRVPARVSFDAQVIIHPDGRIDDAPEDEDLTDLFGEVTDRTIVVCRARDEVMDAMFASSLEGRRSLVVNGWLLVEIAGPRSRAFFSGDLTRERRPMFVLHAAGDHREVAVTRGETWSSESWRVVCPVGAEGLGPDDELVSARPAFVHYETPESGPDEDTAAAMEYASTSPGSLLEFAAGHLQFPAVAARWAVDPDADGGAARPVHRPNATERVKDAYTGELPGRGPFARMRRFFRRHPAWWLAYGVAELVVAALMLLPGLVDSPVLRWTLCAVWAWDGGTNTVAAATTLRRRVRA